VSNARHRASSDDDSSGDGESSNHQLPAGSDTERCGVGSRAKGEVKASIKRTGVEADEAESDVVQEPAGAYAAQPAKRVKRVRVVVTDRTLANSGITKEGDRYM
jgi:hypothetical protein